MWHLYALTASGAVYLFRLGIRTYATSSLSSAGQDIHNLVIDPVDVVVGQPIRLRRNGLVIRRTTPVLNWVAHRIDRPHPVVESSDTDEGVITNFTPFLEQGEVTFY